MRVQAIAAFGKVELWVAWLDPCSLLLVSHNLDTALLISINLGY
jgi:hypothetical protein